MVRVKLRANLGSNDFPEPLCSYRDGDECEVADQWAARLVSQGLAVVVTPPAPVTVDVEPSPVVEPPAAEPVADVTVAVEPAAVESPIQEPTTEALQEPPAETARPAKSKKER